MRRSAITIIIDAKRATIAGATNSRVAPRFPAAAYGVKPPLRNLTSLLPNA
jgi:hypothetical protein